MDHVIFALQHSMDLKGDGVDPMIPFAVVIKGPDKTIKAFMGDPTYADQRFKDTIKDEDPNFVVYVYDSFLTQDGVKYDAVVFEAYDKDDTFIYTLGQKYTPKTEATAFATIGNPGFISTKPNTFNGPAVTPGAIPSTPGSKPWWKIW